MNRRPLAVALPFVLVLAGLTAGGCNKEASSSESVKTDKDDESANAKPKKEQKAPKAPWIDEAGRRGTCEFVKWKGTGADRKAYFKITVPKGKKISSVQTWEFYYDADGKYLERYPHATSVEDEAQALGAEGTGIAAGTDVVECEISRITYEDGTRWFNANLLPDEMNRPKGGVTKDYLKEHSGEKVEVEVVDAKKGKLKLHNISDQKVKSMKVDLVYVKDQGHESQSAYVDLEIKPGKTVEYTMKLDKPAPAEFKSSDAACPTVTFSDDSHFFNKNLDSFER